ncbi:MAG: hypothetical protein OXH52_06765 [Gammaproteobacteria bacterium]|nr:hypothetical protein [Gammaproteobacteria bacterium]
MSCDAGTRVATAARMAARTWGAVTGPLLLRWVATPDWTRALLALRAAYVSGVFEGTCADGLADGERVAVEVDLEAGVTVGLEGGGGGLGPEPGGGARRVLRIELWKLSASRAAASRQAFSMNAARCLETMPAAAAAAAASGAGFSSSSVRTSKTSRTSIWSTRSRLAHRISWLERVFSSWPSTVATAWL